MKHVIVKKDETGAWYACLNVERGAPDKPDASDISVEHTVGWILGS